jgi:5-hydroxyisourate hydrolase / 2-oxo-4-hydroxy-4-carboxy-5-ureidoimidazoline decarboxylase
VEKLNEMDLKKFNSLDKGAALSILSTACGAIAWANGVMEKFPFASEKELLESATNTWYSVCTEKDWKEAFTHHPKIGDLEQLEKKFASTKQLAGKEQSGVSKEDHELITELFKANQDYEKKFGFIFIVFASGRSGREMLTLLNDRLQNDPGEELQVAMGEQHKITVNRLKKVLDEADWSWLPVSQLTTHVLDTSIGKPGKNIKVQLLERSTGAWKTLAQGRTNSDGRIADLLPPGKIMEAANYKIRFDTTEYFNGLRIKSFYPTVEIQFTISDMDHYHVPLLLNPFGYSTYRGS